MSHVSDSRRTMSRSISRAPAASSSLPLDPEKLVKIGQNGQNGQIGQVARRLQQPAARPGKLVKIGQTGQTGQNGQTVKSPAAAAACRSTNRSTPQTGPTGQTVKMVKIVKSPAISSSLPLDKPVNAVNWSKRSKRSKRSSQVTGCRSAARPRANEWSDRPRPRAPSAPEPCRIAAPAAKNRGFCHARPAPF